MRKLVGAGGAVAAEHALQKALRLVDVPSLAQFCHALGITGAAACKFNVVNLVVCVYVKGYLAGTRPLCNVRKHKSV